MPLYPYETNVYVSTRQFMRQTTIAASTTISILDTGSRRLFVINATITLVIAC